MCLSCIENHVSRKGLSFVNKTDENKSRTSPMFRMIMSVDLDDDDGYW